MSLLERQPDLFATWEAASEMELVSAAVAMGAEKVAGWSKLEDELARTVPPSAPAAVESLAAALRRGEDPLGQTFCKLRQSEERRKLGAVYTPAPIIAAMLSGVAQRPSPARIVDPGVGSGRFLLEAGRCFPDAELVGVEIDPLAALLARANLAAAGFAGRSRIILSDYRSAWLPHIEGRTLFVGNPPYVRHHELESGWKHWLSREAKARGYRASQLAGLHVHFFLATLLKARPGDTGSFVTAAEWLDVNYGKLVRDLILGELGGKALLMVEPTALPFPDAASTAVITHFEVGARPQSIHIRRITSFDEPPGDHGRLVPRARLERASRWSQLTRPRSKTPAGWVELGELCRVHRGQVTGANKVWIEGPHSVGLPDSVLFASVTRARELFEVGAALVEGSKLRRVIDLPVDLDVLDAGPRRAVQRFLDRARAAGADQSYVARHRKAWWAVGLRTPAPILATYMARRPPAFVRNLADARHINIAHGLYPREELPEKVLTALADFLSASADRWRGRTYAGGLTKFEPREMERIPVPGPDLLAAGTW